MGSVDVRAFADGELYRTHLQDEWRKKLEADGWTTMSDSPGRDTSGTNG